MRKTERERKCLPGAQVPSCGTGWRVQGWRSREAQADVFFDHPRLPLTESDKCLGRRYPGADGIRELTFKGPRHFDHGDKPRLEISAGLTGGQLKQTCYSLASHGAISS